MSDNKIVYSNEGIKISVDQQGSKNEVSVLKGVIDETSYEYLEVSGNVEFLNDVNISGKINGSNFNLLPSLTTQVLFNNNGSVSSSADFIWKDQVLEVEGALSASLFLFAGSAVETKDLYVKDQITIDYHPPEHDAILIQGGSISLYGGNVTATKFYGDLDGKIDITNNIWNHDEYFIPIVAGPGSQTVYRDTGLSFLTLTHTLKAGYFDGDGSLLTNISYNNLNDKPTLVSAVGSDGELQFKSGTSLGASSDLSWDDANKILTVGSTSTLSTTLRVISSTSTNATIEAHGGVTNSSIQGTGVLYAGQDNRYGGGIFYSGDGSPTYAANEGSSDRISFFNRNQGTNNVVFYYQNTGNDVFFNGDVTATNFIGNGSLLAGISYNNLSDKPSLLSAAGSSNWIQYNNGSNGLAANSLLYWNTTSGQEGLVSNSTYIGRWTTDPTYAGFYNNNLTKNGSNYALIQSSVGATYVNSASGYDLNLRIGNATKLLIASDGDIGIGTTTTNARLEIKQKSDSVGGGIRLVESSHSSYWDIFLSDTAPDNRLEFAYEGTTKAYIDKTDGSVVASYFKGDGSNLTNINYNNISNAPVTGDITGLLKIKQSSDEYTSGLRFIEANSTLYWSICLKDADDGFKKDNRLSFFYYNGSSVVEKGYINPDSMGGALNFTGQHRNKSDTINVKEKEKYLGLIVVSEGTYESIQSNSITLNEALPKVSLSSKRNQKSVFGVVSDIEDENMESREYALGNFVSVSDKSLEDTRLVINSLGEGGIWICNINGGLENGDYITTCEIPGYGMKQDSEFLANYTVAKITCDCDFDLQSSIYVCEEFEHEGTMYKRAFVGCTYHCG